MATHLSDIGFPLSEETFYDDLIKIIETYIEKSSREVIVGAKSYLVLYIDEDIEFWFPIGEGKTVDPASIEIHYNTHRWDNVVNPKWIEKTGDGAKGLLNFREINKDYSINANIPNALLLHYFEENYIYKSQIACFVEHIAVYKDFESFCKENEGVSEMSFVQTNASRGSIAELLEEDATAWISGIVESVEVKKNSYTKKEYLHILIKCGNIKFDLLVAANEVDEIKLGDIVSAYVWISGKIRKAYEGFEFGNIERLKPGNDQLKTIDDLFNVLNKCWCKETAYPSCQLDWTDNDPSYGQCAITAMLVNDMFGGTIHRIKLNGGGTHYFNKINGNYIDLTREQFDLYDIPIDYESNEEMQREYCGENLDTKKRYELLKVRITDYLKTL